MYKNMLKRSLLSIRRKTGRTIILSLIFFMMASLVLSSITIKSAVNAEMDYAKSTLGGTVSIQADMDAIRETQQAEMSAGGDRKEIFKNMARPAVDIETADKIAAYSDYVKDYSYEITAPANVDNIEIVESASNNFGPGFPGSFGGGKNPMNSSQVNSDLTLQGINAYAYIDSVKNETLTIKDGTYFDETTKNGVIISYELAELNNLKINNTFKLKNTYTEKSFELKVVGIYDCSNDFANANTIYANTDTVSQFLSSDDYNSGNYKVSNVNFYMLNSDYADEFVAKINEDFPDLSKNNLKIAVNTTEYDAMSGPIENVGSFATTILVIVIVAAIIIITLIVTINVKDRRYEMGVLLSLGATKKNIVSQIAAELLIVGSIGFVLASFTGTFTAKFIGDGIIASQTASSAQQSERNFGRPGTQIGKPGSAPSGAPSNSNMPPNTPQGKDRFTSGVQNSEPIKLDINATPADFLLLFVAGYLVIIFALVVPSFSVLKYQPKEILSGKE